MSDQIESDNPRRAIELERFSFAGTGAALGYSVFALAEFDVGTVAIWPLRAAIIFLAITLVTLYLMILSLARIEAHAFFVRVTKQHTPQIADWAVERGWFASERHERHYVLMRWVAAFAASAGFGAVTVFFVIFALMT